MKPADRKIPGITIDVADLVGVRRQVSGLSPGLIRRRASFRSGARDTRVRGRGMEYEESRAYVPGDDMRTMDWQVMARTGEPHSKVFAEEKERRFLLAVDLSSSMFFGSDTAFKSYAAAHTAAHVGWLASYAGDRLGGLIVAPDSHYEVRPGKSRSSLIRLFHFLSEAGQLSLPPDPGPSRLNHLLRELNRVVKPGSIIALISDFLGIDSQSAEILSAVVKHNDVSLYWIYDALEVDPWAAGSYPVWHRSQLQSVEVNGDHNGWLHELQSTHREAVEDLCAQFNLPLLSVSCNTELTGQIIGQLQQS